MQIEGHPMEAGRDAGGFRDFLAGQPIHAGAPLEIWLGGRWLPGRYEAAYQHEQGFFYTSLFDQEDTRPTAIRIDRQVMRFRWPGQHDDDTLDARYTRVVAERRELRGALREVQRWLPERSPTVSLATKRRSKNAPSGWPTYLAILPIC